MSRISRGSRRRLSALAVLGLVAGAGCTTDDYESPLSPADSPADSRGRVAVIDYDSKSEAEYEQKWALAYGPLELAAGGTRDVGSNGRIELAAVPFHVGADYSVYDHLKYIGISTQAFDVPENGSLTFSAMIEARTPGTVDGRVIQGCYGPPGSFAAVGDPCASPWSAVAMEGQQAGVVLNMINFATGQLFDWFVSGSEVFALVERLPSNVTNPALAPGDPGYVGLDKAYTQIIRSAKVAPGRQHRVSTRYTRGPGVSMVEYFLNGRLFATVEDVGIPLDVQGKPFTGVYPSYGPGEVLADELDSFVIGHGVFSLLDAYPFQHPERPDLSVSIPMSERLFGQGAVGTFSHFQVTVEQGS